MIVMEDMKLSVEPSDTLHVSVGDSGMDLFMSASDITKVQESMDYEDLKNKPSLNDRTISGNMNEIDPTVGDWAKEPTRPVYNATDVGAVGRSELTDIPADVLEQMWNSI